MKNSKDRDGIILRCDGVKNDIGRNDRDAYPNPELRAERTARRMFGQSTIATIEQGPKLDSRPKACFDGQIGENFSFVIRCQT